MKGYLIDRAARTADTQADTVLAYQAADTKLFAINLNAGLTHFPAPIDPRLRLLRISILTRGDSGIITFSHLACGRGGATCRLLRVRLRRAR